MRKTVRNAGVTVAVAAGIAGYGLQVSQAHASAPKPACQFAVHVTVSASGRESQYVTGFCHKRAPSADEVARYLRGDVLPAWLKIRSSKERHGRKPCVYVWGGSGQSAAFVCGDGFAAGS